MRSILAILVFTIASISFSQGQQILMDKGVRVNELWCFPLHTDENIYLYLPPRARLVLDEEKNPVFSFMRYITKKPSKEASPNTVSEAGGGSILHFLILYDTPEEQIKKAQRMLREKLDNAEIIIRGPVIFEKGRYALISSILNGETGEQEKRLFSTGEAPILENSSIALSFKVNPKDSKLLLESFKMKTPDISLLFDLTFSGLSENYDATLEIDWSKVRSSKKFSAGGSVYYVGADIELGFDDLIKNNSIRLETTGNNTSMEKLLNTVYDKLLNLMFKPVEQANNSAEQGGNMLEAITSLVGAGGALSSRKMTGFGFNASFKLKELKTKGKSNLFFKGRSNISRHHFITFNIGDLYKKYGDDEQFFRDIPFWDPAFQQREVFVGIDGDLEKEFESMLNSVTVTIRKKHLKGNETNASILIKKESFKNYNGNLSMQYLNHGDTIINNWLTYDYRTEWKFKGGGSYETPWLSENAAMINLFVPFHRKTIHLDGDMNSLREKGVRAISVQIDYPFFDHIKKHRTTIRPGDNLEEKTFQITLPNTEENIDYSITWFKKNTPPETLKGTDRFGLIFIDEIPER